MQTQLFVFVFYFLHSRNLAFWRIHKVILMELCSVMILCSFWHYLLAQDLPKHKATLLSKTCFILQELQSSCNSEQAIKKVQNKKDNQQGIPSKKFWSVRWATWKRKHKFLSIFARILVVLCFQESFYLIASQKSEKCHCPH